jgi:hypothetical protein
MKEDPVPSLRKKLRNTTSHCAGADHADHC